MEPEIYRKFVEVTKEFPVGLIVYHKASAERGMVLAYNLYTEVTIGIDWGKNNIDYCLPIILSKEKVPFHHPDKDGDDWKE